MTPRSLFALSLLLAPVAAPSLALAQVAPGAESSSAALPQLDGWSVSGLSRAQGALAPNLWAEADPTALAAALARLPTIYESPAALALARRVLLSGGTAPAGDAADALRRRFEALGKMGAADQLSVMAAGAGPSLSDPAVATYAAQAELARGRRPEACLRGRQANSPEPTPFLLRLRAYCAAVTGDRAAADLALELARGADDQAWYAGAVGAAAGAPGARPPAARYTSSLGVALSLAGQLRPGPNPLNDASSMALVAVARAEAAPQPARAQAAAMAFRRGAIAASEARTILKATPAEITSGLPPILTALRQVEAAPGTLPAAIAIAGVLRQAADKPADFAAASVFFKDDIAALQAAPDLASALLFARAALAAGDSDLAGRLVASARAAGVANNDLAPLDAALSLARGERGQTALMAVKRRIDGGGPAAARDAAILIAMGAPMDGAVGAYLLGNPPEGGARADSGAMTALLSAAERGSVGEAGILAVVAAGDGPATLDAGSLTLIIRALRQTGLEDHARAFAIEALLAGPPG